MGGKQNIPGYNRVFYPAYCLIFILISIFISMGCQQHNYYPQFSIKSMEGGRAGGFYLQKANEHIATGNFQNAFDANKKAFDLLPPKLKSDAIFQKALIYAHPDNPDKNYENTMICLEFIDLHPNNTIQAISTVSVLSILKENQALVKKTDAQHKEIQKNKKKLEKGNKELASLVTEQKKLKSYINQLRQQIIQLKEIDLNASKQTQGVSE